jgi:hypothetical protein
VTVTNVGKVATTIGAIVVPAAPPVAASNFQLSNNNCPISPASLAPKKKCTFEVTFTPFAVNPVTGTLMIPYGDSLNAEVALSGDGTPVTLSGPKSESFPSTMHGLPSKTQKKVTITNKTAVTITFTTVDIGADFSIIGGTDLCAGQPLLAKAKCTVMVGFKPLSSTPTGAVSGETLTYSFTYGGPLMLNGNIEITLKGTVK